VTYLWIDALCISQHHDSRDWNEQSSKMKEIYGGPTLTIVAANSSSVVHGFLKERKLHYIPLGWFPHRASPGESLRSTAPQPILISPSWNSQDDKIAGPWTTRGWTMQEGLLPNRLLFHTSSQMIWKCCTIQEYERGTHRRRRPRFLEFRYIFKVQGSAIILTINSRNLTFRKVPPVVRTCRKLYPTPR
jgi:hypothetical protein